MKFVIDLNEIYSYLAGLTARLDFTALFFVIFIALGCFSAISFTLCLLADKRIKFSVQMMVLFALVSCGLYGLAYIDCISNANTFKNVSLAACYSISEFVAITVLYAVFFGFAHKDSKQNDATAAEAAAAYARAVNMRENDLGRFYKLKTFKTPTAYKDEDMTIDFNGVYEFLESVKASGKNVDEAERLEKKIRFYDGLPINKGTLPVINNLFSYAVRLAREE